MDCQIQAENSAKISAITEGKAMRSCLRHFIFLLALFYTVLPVAAHHGMSALFDFNERFSRTGTLVRLDWRNPHIYLFVEAREADGQVQTWRFEGPSPVFFRNRDLASKSDFVDSIEKTVIVDASRARDGSLAGLIRSITLANGKFVPLCPDNC
jgi:hypothetical protein